METLSQGGYAVNILGRDSGPLGILPNNRPATNGVASSDTPPSSFLVNKETGEIYIKETDSRLRRYIRQSAAKNLLSKHRVSWCLRRTKVGELPAVLKSKSTGKAHYGGLITCGRVWACPVCAAKVSQRRRDEMSLACDQWRNQGGQLLLVTSTFAHSKHDVLADLITKQKKAIDSMTASRVYKSIRSAHGVIGKVRALEITHGSNGWHPHIHEIWFLKTDNINITQAAIHTRLYDEWRNQCMKKGLGCPSLEHGIDVRDGSAASSYISKWGIEDELTKANAKEGRGDSRHPFQLLDSYMTGDKQAGALYAEYVEVFNGKRQLVWSKGLKKLFDLEDKTDEELALEQEESAYHLGNLTMEQWNYIISYRGYQTDLRSQVLTRAEFGGWDSVQQYLEQIGANQQGLVCS
jgi:hypothetical protein